jgi:hypothetical protein
VSVKTIAHELVSLFDALVVDMTVCSLSIYCEYVVDGIGGHDPR